MTPRPRSRHDFEGTEGTRASRSRIGIVGVPRRLGSVRASAWITFVFLWSCTNEVPVPRADPRTPEEATRRLFEEQRREGALRCACRRAALDAGEYGLDDGLDDASPDDPCIERVERLTRECVVEIYSELLGAFPEVAYCFFARARESRACVEATGCDELALESCAPDATCPFACEEMTGEARAACQERVATAELAAWHCE